MAFDNPYEPATHYSLNRVDYFRSATFFTENSNWLMNLVIIALAYLSANLVPLVGAIIVMGYQVEVILALTMYPNKSYPDFSFDKFGDYLARGFWVFLAGFVYGLIMTPIIGLLVLCVFLGSGFVGILIGDEAGFIVTIASIVMGAMVVGVAAIGMQMLMIPAMLRVGLTQDFSEAFNFGFMRDFVSRMWLEMVISGIFLAVFSLAANLIGMLMLCVGVFFTIGVVTFCQTHLGYQLYAVYLGRGGTPIPAKFAADPAAVSS